MGRLNTARRYEALALIRIGTCPREVARRFNCHHSTIGRPISRNQLCAGSAQIWGGFLIRRSYGIRRFIAGFLKCDSRTIMKSFLKKIALKLTGNLHKNPAKFLENSRAIFLRNDFIIVQLSHLRNPAKNLRIVELRLMRNPPQIWADPAQSWFVISVGQLWSGGS